MTPMAAVLVIVAVVVNIGGCVALLIGLSRRAGEGGSTTETTGHVWDEELRELNNPLPRWWLWLFILTIIFGLVYVVLYPGMGNFAGTSGWTSERQWAEQSAAADKLLQKTFKPFESQSVEALAANADAVRIGRN